MNINKKKYIVLALATLPMLNSCSESWLEPKPLSFYSPENTYVNAEGLYAALTACERNMRHEYFGDGAPILTEMFLTDLAVHGKTDESASLVDLDNEMLPARTKNDMKGKNEWYWEEGFKGIKYANIAISRLDAAKYKDEAERKAVLGAAYFQRAYRYYKLTHQFGDVPYLNKEITEPKLDFYTYDRWSILEQCKKDMEYAYQWVPEVQPRGRANKDACGVLLMKFCMATGDFDRAIEVGKEVVSRHPLMTQRFTSNKTKANTNLMHDLHSVEAKVDMSNTEGIMYVVAHPSTTPLDGSNRIYTMRNGLPYWAKGGAIKTPDGKTGTAITPDKADKNTDIDNDSKYGRGIGTCRPTNYYQYDIWTDKEKNDLRGPFNHDSWKRMEDLRYNDAGLKKSNNPYYGQNLVRPVDLSVADSIRCWYMWPHYKLFVPDPTKTQDLQGGETPWYIYRSAEVYLMMAECYYWKGDAANEAAMLNVVRERAGAEPLSGNVGIAEVLAERARELYYEENRHVELVRISYLYAKTGKACEALGGRTYKLDNLCGPGGVGTNCKDAGVNFYFDWVMAHNNFFNKGVKIPNGEYRMSVHHILWPIPETAITTNTGGVINQNIGYPGAENNIEPLKVEPADPDI
ncbi:RagB/SusD family nutrient uptake outer membrane protein [uncultured Parabacteroides sp.]|uniref:RagB/SusD family nutrient uptake outer membrane protein n=1 Tax=uncultured Parabacteroides sp. TaxID=512312 RepID=UPI0028055647|nr:RagB/SusD family nutrient uptake outer membrane protein [uncultured Parabacteroides sp.]